MMGSVFIGKYNNKNKGQNNKNKYSNYYKQDNYNNYRDLKSYYRESNNGYKYNKMQIRRFLTNPQYYEKEIKQVSLYLASTSSHYVRLIHYLSNMLTLDHIIIPNNSISKYEDELNTKLLDYYNKANCYINKFNVKHELAKIIPTILIEDVFYGYECYDKNSSTIRKLPSNYCRIVGIEDGVFIFTFNFRYFDGKEHLLRDYPDEFIKLYKKYKETGYYEQELDPNLGAVCFKFRDDLPYAFPFLAPLFEELIELEEKKDLANEKEKLNNYKLLIQQIPMKKDPKNEKDMLFDSLTAQQFHNNVTDVVPNNVGVITTPMPVDSISLTGNSSTDTANLSEVQDILFTAAGFGNIFSSNHTNEEVFKNANISDQSVMFKLLRQFERFFNARLKKKLGNRRLVNIVFLDITYFNRTDMIKNLLELAQYGFPKSIIATAMGLSQSQFLGLNDLERLIGIEKRLIPLSSSHTQST